MTPTIEGNKLIAEFMGYVMHNHTSYRTFEKDGRHLFEATIQYDTKWDWLMPVVEKILFKTGGSHAQLDTMIISALSEVNIKSVWQAVTQFIIWYNQQNQKQ